MTRPTNTQILHHPPICSLSTAFPPGSRRLRRADRADRLAHGLIRTDLIRGSGSSASRRVQTLRRIVLGPSFSHA